VVVVSDGRQIQADVEQSGDEPLMLARMVPGAAVLVSSSRYVAGRVAESRLGCTVHVLDDGFQHFDLMRDIDLLVAPETLDDVRTLPAGRFREPLDAAAAADALLVEEQSAAAALRHLVPIAFTFSRRLAGPDPDRPAFAFAGIARPDRFYRDLENDGWQITGRRSFPDHHHYSLRDIVAVSQAARASGAQVVLTTEKDAVRLAGSRSDAGAGSSPTPPIVAIPQKTSIDPAFHAWLAERLRGVRSA
jgi:tetraacyldisaccharide 4'-kinase